MSVDRCFRPRTLAGVIGLSAAVCGITAAYAFDPLRTDRLVPETPAVDMLGSRTDVCTLDDLPVPLKLYDAVERAMCNNPKTRQAWANVKIQAAAVGTARTAYLPTVTGTLQQGREWASGYPASDTLQRSNKPVNQKSANVSLNWVLYDFGGRSAALENATALLAAAQANQRATLQTVFATVAKDFYAAQAARGTLVAAREIEATARASSDAAAARVEKGAASITDRLQAETTLAEAVVNRTNAQREWKVAVGVLATDMNLPPTDELVLPDVGDGVPSNSEFIESVETLIEQARRSYPGVVAAEAQVAAARAKARQVRAEGRPRLSLVSQFNYNKKPNSLQGGYPDLRETQRGWYLGVQATFPIFEGFARRYQTRQAEAQIELQLEMLDETRRLIELEVWNAYQTVLSATKNLDHSATLLSLAQRSYGAARHRYRMGVGSVLELLNAQEALARGKMRRIEALTDWRSARLQLAAKLGDIGTWGHGAAS